METWRVTRVISADPVSAALLMGGRSAFSLWPGLQSVSSGSQSVQVALSLPLGPPAVAVVHAAPPERTPFGIVCRFWARGPQIPDLEATLSLRPARMSLRRPAGHRTTAAELVLHVGDGGQPLARRVLPMRAARFLDALATAAEARAIAA
jgi:hypothetical protein